jgi:multidrug efflux pump subunit AcrB
VTQKFRDLDDVNNVESDLSGGNPEVEVKVDPEKATKAGLSPVVSTSLGALLGGTTAGDVAEAEEVGSPEAVSRVDGRGLSR